MSASDFFSGKSAQPKLIDLETKAISTSSAPIASAPSAKSSPVEAPSKSQSAPANYHTPTATATATRKAEPVSAFKEEFSPESSPEAKPAAKAEEPEAKSLEIEQPESEDEEPTPAPAVVAPTPAPAAKEEPTVKEIPAPAKSEVTAVSFSDHPPRFKLTIQPQNQLLVKKLSDKATTPTRGSALAAGYDLYAAEDKVVPANGKVLVDLQLSIAVPEGTYGRVAPRSGLGMFLPAQVVVY